jgi:hypothetical protein
VRESREITLTVDLDRKQNRWALDLALIPRANTKLARLVKGLDTGRSRFAGLGGSTLALSARFPLPGFLAGKPAEWFEEVADPKKRPLIRRLAKALGPTLTAEVVDIGFSMGGGKGGEVLLGLKVKNGRKLEGLLRDFVKDWPADERKMWGIRWNRSRHAGTRIHGMKFPTDVAGLHIPLDVFLAIQGDVVLVGAGPELSPAASPRQSQEPAPLTALKGAIDGLGKPSAAAPSLLRVEFNPFVLFFWFWIHFAEEQESGPTVETLMQLAAGTPLNEEMAKKIGKGVLVDLVKTIKKDKDKVRVSVVVKGGEALRLQMEGHTHVFLLIPVIEKLLISEEDKIPDKEKKKMPDKEKEKTIKKAKNPT